MKKAIAIIVSLLFVLSVAGLSFAAEKAMKKEAAAEKTMEKKAPVKVKWLSGEVSAVDAAAMTLTVKGRRAEVALTVNDKTSIKMGKEKKTLADVKVGDRVATRYSEVEGKNVAKSIAIRGEKKAEKKAKKMEKKAEPAKE
jgi:Cu/Ag efflux protein CusF